MRGLMTPELEQRMAGQQPDPSAQDPSQQDPAQQDPSAQDDTVSPDEGEKATPEEQAGFDRFVVDGLAVIFGGGKVKPAILELLDENPADLIKIFGNAKELEQFSPVVALAATTVAIVLEVVRRSGEQKPDDAIVLHGGKLLLEELANVAEEAKIHSFTEEELNKAFYIGCDLYRETASAEGLIDTAGLKQEFDEIKQADAQGRIGEVLPQLRSAQQDVQGGGDQPGGQQA